MIDGFVQAEVTQGILRLTIENGPANLLSLALMRSLQAEMERARTDEAVRVVVLGAAGEHFSAGHDLKELAAHRRDADAGQAFFAETFASCSELMKLVARFPKPVVAQVDGTATAAGCQLVASCDLAVASDRSRFGVNGINVGLFCTTPAVALTRAISRKHAMEMLLTGELIDAPTAERFGLINHVVPSGSLAAFVDELAGKIASKSPVALRLGKQAVQFQCEMDLASAYEHASRVMVENMLASDAEEGIQAFLEHRHPKLAPDREQ